MTGKIINRGEGYGLEVPCKCHISGQEKAVGWIKRKETTFLQEQSFAVNVQERNINKKKFLCVRFMEDDYGSNVYAGLEKSVRFREVSL